MYKEGTLFEIRPAYNSETGQRDYYDEFALCECTVLKQSREDVLVLIKGTNKEVWINRGRLKGY